MKVGFLLGAGFSKGLHSAMPLTNELISKLELPSFLPPTAKGDLELTLSYLWTNYPWNREQDFYRNRQAFFELAAQIHAEISKAEYEAWSSIVGSSESRLLGRPRLPNMVYHPSIPVPSPQLWQAAFAGMICDNSRFCIVTTNYDTLLERFMIANTGLQLTYPAPLQPLNRIWTQIPPLESASYIPPIKKAFATMCPHLFKLHGSVSWFTLDSLDANMPIYSPDMDYTYATSPPMPYELDNTLTSIIVPPVADKTSMYANKVLRSQWIMAAKSLTECDKVYCVGYSLPSTDLPMKLFLSQACTNVKEVIIVNLDKDDDLLRRYKEVFPVEATYDWIVGSDCVQKMAIQLLSSEYPDVLFV